MVRKWPVIGAILAVLWLFVRGVELAPRPIAGEFLIGLAFGMTVSYGSRRFYAEESDLRRNLRVLPYVLLYSGAFVRDLIVANVEVAYRVLHPQLPIEPAVVVLPLRVRTDLAITIIANSITLTPGTLTMDHDGEENVLLVHAIACDDPEEVIAPIRQWEEYALGIFDEDLDPDDPVPDVDYDAAGDVVRSVPEVSDYGE
jgi:multicomponent Na+:H+ antiporter subunit E